MTPPVTVTTVIYNSSASLPAYADAISPCLDRGLVKVVIVDNASPDDSATVAACLIPGAQLIASERNLGFAGGCNRAWPLVDTRYWLLLNPDVIANADSVERLVRWMDGRPTVGIASPKLRGPNGQALTVARAHDAISRTVAEASRLHKLVPRGLRARWLLGGQTQPGEVFRGWVPGAAMMVRVDAVRTAGLLEERLFMYGEDRELCWRVQRHGWEVGVCSDVELVHDGGASTKKTWSESETVKREVAGHVNAASLMRGELWARGLAVAQGLSLVAESISPGRDPATRRETRQRGRAYIRRSFTPQISVPDPVEETR